MKLHRIGCLLVCMLLAGVSRAAELPEPLLRAARAHGVALGDLSIFVILQGQSKPRLAYNAQKPMNPASTMKLVTTSAALHVLGPAFNWRTEVYADGTVKDGVLEGNLLFKGSGDPKFTLEEFWMLLRQLRARGLSQIRGDVVLDRTLIETGNGAAGDFDGDSLRPYNALPDAFLVNFSAVRLDFLPRPAGNVDILMSPSLPQIQIVNQLRAVDAPCNEWPQDPQRENGGKLIFSGKFPRSCGETTRNYSPLVAPAYAGALFRELWRDLGGTFSGQVRDGSLPSSATLLYSQESESLAEVIRDINKFSNNVMARQLFLSIGSAANAPPWTREKSATAITRWLERQGLNFPELVLENGSGLSRKERISAEHLGALLMHVAGSPLAPEFMASLPLSGVDGTMRKRLNDSGVAGRAHIKTGYLDGVRASAGYVLDEKGRLAVVVCLVNGAGANESKPLHDALIEWVHTSAGEQNCCRKK